MICIMLQSLHMPLSPHHLLLRYSPDWFNFLVPAYPGCSGKEAVNACLSFQFVTTNGRHTGTEAMKGRAQKNMYLSRSTCESCAGLVHFRYVAVFSCTCVFFKVSVLCKRSASVSKTPFNVSWILQRFNPNIVAYQQLNANIQPTLLHDTHKPPSCVCKKGRISSYYVTIPQWTVFVNSALICNIQLSSRI